MKRGLLLLGEICVIISLVFMVLGLFLRVTNIALLPVIIFMIFGLKIIRARRKELADEPRQ